MKTLFRQTAQALALALLVAVVVVAFCVVLTPIAGVLDSTNGHTVSRR